MNNSERFPKFLNPLRLLRQQCFSVKLLSSDIFEIVSINSFCIPTTSKYLMLFIFCNDEKSSTFVKRKFNACNLEHFSRLWKFFSSPPIKFNLHRFGAFSTALKSCRWYAVISIIWLLEFSFVNMIGSFLLLDIYILHFLYTYIYFFAQLLS